MKNDENALLFISFFIPFEILDIYFWFEMTQLTPKINAFPSIFECTSSKGNRLKKNLLILMIPRIAHVSFLGKTRGAICHNEIYFMIFEKVSTVLVI